MDCYLSTLDRISQNRAINLSVKQIALLFLVDPEGIRDYLYCKKDVSLINEVYRLVTGKEPIYYAKTVTGWK